MNFFDTHTHWLVFLFFITFLPRTTMLLTGICFMNFAYPILFWIGWVIAPRFTIAIIASYLYFQINPILCIFAWINALVFGGWGWKILNGIIENE